MAPYLLLACLILLSTYCLAETVSLRHVLKDRFFRASERSVENSHFLPPVHSTLGSPDDKLELLDICLAASVDGRIYGLNRSSGQVLWTLPSPSVYKSAEGPPPALRPLVRTRHAEIDPFHGDGENEELYVIEPQSGNIYILPRIDAPLQQLPFSMRQLVDMGAFSFSVDDISRNFVGRKETSLLVIELETGRLKNVIDSSSECPWDPSEWDAGAELDLDLDELDGTKPARPTSTSTEVLIGRTDYYISIHSKPNKPNGPRLPAQNLVLSTYGPNNQDHVMQTAYGRTIDNMYIQSTPSGEIYLFKALQKRGNEWASREDSQPIWMNSFAKPIVGIFDVLRTPNRHNPFALLQPQPRLQDVLPNFDFDNGAASEFTDDGTYIGLVGDNSSSLFAMSPDSYPLVVFHRGTAEDYRRGRAVQKLLDASPGENDETGSGSQLSEDLTLDIDSLNRLREDRKRCTGTTGMWDRRCAVGLRPVEPSASRLNRLISDRESTVDNLVVGGQRQDALTNATFRSLPIIHEDESQWKMLTPISGAILTLLMFLYGLWFMTKKRQSPARVTALPSAEHPELLDEITTTKIIIDSEPQEPFANPVNSPVVVAPSEVEADYGTSPAMSVIGVAGPEVDQVALTLTPSAPSNIQAIPREPQSGEWVVLETNADGDADEDSDPEGEAVQNVLSSGKKRGTRRGKRRRKHKGGTANNNSQEEHLEGGGKQANGVEDGIKIPHSPLPSPSLTPMASTSSQGRSTTVSMQLSVSDEILGHGSHGTVVYRGSLQGRAVAVKRLLQEFVTLAAREVNILQESDDHPNVIRYFYQESHGNFLYIALELCPASLADIIESPQLHPDIIVSFDPKRAISQIASGVRHLHALKIIHRDIKPQNILISGAKKGKGNLAGHRMLISDFGLCRKLDSDQSSFLPTAHGAMAAGTVGWRAPEILRGDVKLDESVVDDSSQSSRSSTGTAVNGATPSRLTRLTKSIDIFSLGCLFYYILSKGGHPYGDRYERDMNIIKDIKSLDFLESYGEEGLEAIDLITQMLDKEASARPDTTTCLAHPFFWTPARHLTFLTDASDRFEIMCRDPRDPELIDLETNAFRVVGNDWHSRLDKVFIDNLGKFRKYDGRSVQDLMRALRNKKHHYQDLPENVKRHLGPLPEGFLGYFTRRFPNLFLHVHAVVQRTDLHTESMFRAYFELPE